jgi:uncharacterized protein
MEVTRSRGVKESGRPAIIITGAASGIGREIARLAALEDAFLVLIDGARRQLDDLVTELGAQGARAAALCIDPAGPDALPSIERILAANSLYCDVIVNSGARVLFGPAAARAPAEQLSVIALNVRALSKFTLRFVPEMVARGRGGVLNVGSLAGYTPVPNMAVYAASKAFVNAFTAALASELAHTGVTVTCVVPGLGIRQFLQRSPRAPGWLLGLTPRPDSFEAAVAAWLAFKTGQHVVMPKRTSRLAVVATRIMGGLLLRFLGAVQRPAQTM